MILIKILLLIFILYGVYVFTPHLKKNGVYVGLPIVVSGIVLFIYIFDLLFQNINIPIYIIGISGFMLGTYNIYSNRLAIFDKKQISIKNIIHNDNLLLILLIFVLIVLNYRRTFNSWDEFTHWGTIIKYINVMGTLYPDILQKYPFAGADYIPGLPIFNYFVIFFIGYSEDNILLSNALFIMIMLLPLYEVALKVAKLYLLLIFYLVFILFIILSGGWSSVLIDGPISATFFTCIAIYFMIEVKNRNWVPVLLPMSLLVLLKDAGLYLSIFLLGFILIDTFYKKGIKLESLKSLIIDYSYLFTQFILFVIFPVLLWKIFIYLAKIPTTLESLNTKIVSRINMCCDSTEALILDNYFNKFFGHTLIDNTGTFFNIMQNHIKFLSVDIFLNNHNFFAAKILLILLLSGSLIAIAYPNFRNKLRFLMLQIYLFLGTILYSVSIMLNYLFIFERREGLALASFERYHNTFFLGWSLVNIYFFLKLINIQNIKNKYILICLSFIFILPFLSQMNKISKEYFADRHIGYSARRFPMHEWAQNINSLTPPNSKIAIGWRGSDSYEWWVLNYELLPRVTSSKNAVKLCPSVGKPYFSGDVFSCDLDISTFKNYLSNFDYYAIGFGVKDLQANYKDLFSSDIQYTSNSGLFKVVNTGTDVKLVFLSK